MDSSTFKHILIDWYEDHKRDLPWRHTKDPYKIWLSEIILQQTRVAQGTKYYHRFVDTYPTIDKLANASQDDVLALWKGLGYYSRARNLHDTAQYIMEHHHGVFPTDYQDVLALKGIGKYTAAAICSFAYQLNYPVVDGNVLRVITRLYAINEPIDISSTNKKVYDISASLIDAEQPDIYNQAIMEFGAMQCTSGTPDCSSCPFVDSCMAQSQGLVGEIPYKSKKIKRSSRYFHYLIIEGEEKTILERRENKDIWQGLYQFPMIEKNKIDIIAPQDIANKVTEILPKEVITTKISEIYTQKLTHRDIYARFYHVKVSDIQTVTKNTYFLVDKKKVPNFALPKVIDAYLAT